MPLQNTKNQFPQRWMTAKEHRGIRMDSNDRNKKRIKLPAQAKLLLAVQGLFAVANALSGTFVNVYLWKVSSNLALIGLFTLCGQLSGAATFWFSGKWVKERNKMNFLRLGVICSALFYLLVLLLQTRAVNLVIPLGIVQGMAAGFFWLAFNVVYFEITGPDDRDKFNGWSGLLGSGAGMLAPWFSGILITRMDDAIGYKIIFAISLAVFMVAAVVSFFLKKRKASCCYEATYAFKQLKQKGSPWRNAFPALCAQGLREGVFIFMIGLLVYISTSNEMKLGNYSLITSGVALVCFLLAGKFLKPRFRTVSMLIGTLFMIVFMLPFFWDINYTTLLIFGIGTAIVFPLFQIPMTSAVFDIIGRDQESADHRVEYVVFRELGLNAGRIFGTVMFILFISLDPGQLGLKWFVVILGSSPLLAALFMRRVLRKTNDPDPTQ